MNTYTAWIRQLHTLVNFPVFKVAPRGIETREVLGARLEVADLRQSLIVHPARNLNYKFAVAEALWITLGLDDVGLVARYNSQMNRFSDDGKILAGAYGPRLATQWRYVIDTLRWDPSSRQAVATIWTPNPEPSKDIPCTIALQFLVRDTRLHLIVTMRSSDIWLGLPYDMFVFSMLANMVAGELDVQAGGMVLQLGSSHLYADNVAKAKEVLGDMAAGGVITQPRLPGFPTGGAREQLVRALRDPKEAKVSYPPWSYYAEVLRAERWVEARQILESL